MDRTGPNWTELAPQWPELAPQWPELAPQWITADRTGQKRMFLSTGRVCLQHGYRSRDHLMTYTSHRPSTSVTPLPMDNPDIATGRLLLANKMDASYPKLNIISVWPLMLSKTNNIIVWQNVRLSIISQCQRYFCFIILKRLSTRPVKFKIPERRWPKNWIA